MADFSQYETILYLDDMRKPLLPNAVQVRNYEEFVRYLKTRPMPDAISFDHDLTLEHYPTYEEEEECYRTNRINYENYSTKTGMDAVRYIIENKLPLKRWFVHSYNEVGTANMTALLMKYNPKGYDPSLRELPFELEEQEVWGGKVKDGFRQESAIAVQTAERMLSEVDPQACGTSKVMDGFWIETHTIGCRNSADTPEENWWDEHYEIYDEYSKDGISTVIGDPGDGKFVTITPQRKTAPKVAGYEPWMRYWLTGGCDLFALALYERIPAARFIGVFGKNSNHHVGLEKDGSYYDVRGKMRKEEFLQGLAAQEIRLVSRDNVIGFFGQGMWLHHEDELAKTSEMREARKAVNRVFGSGRHTAAATTYREEVTFLDQSYGLEDATTSTGLERVVWERPTRSKRPLKGGKPSVIKTNTVEQIGFANNAQYPHIRALHVSGDTEFWFNQLVKDYGRDAKAWVVEIKPVKGDYLMDDVSYSMPDQWGNKADSYILITSRTELIEGKDFKYVRELGPEDLIEDNSEEGYDPDYKFSEQASLKTAMASKIAGPLTVKPKNSLLRPKTAIGDKGWSYDEPAPDRNSFFEDVENPHSEQPLHVAANEADDFSEDAMYKALEVQNQMAWEVLTEYQTALKGKNVNYRQKWRVVPSARLKKIWSDYANTGFVRDEAGINEIADIVVENIFKIDVNTILCGHTATNPESWASEVLDIEIPRNRDYFEKLPHFFDDEEGSWRISDSAMPGLEDLAIRLMDARTGEQKLQIIDRILQIAHPRSDIAGWLVSGGRNTLNYLFEHGTREEPAPGPGYKTVDKFDKARERQQHLQKALKKRKLKGAAEADKWLSQCRTKDAALAGEVKVLPSTGGWKDAQGIDHFHHAIEIVRPGRPVENGVVTVAIADAAPEVMEITWIGGPEGTGFTKFNLGVGGFREVIRQLKSHHPGIIWVKGVRVSGADPGHTMEHAASLYDENPLPPTDGPPPEGYIRIYRGVNPERNSFAQSDDTHGYWYTTTYENAVSYANWDWDSEGELGPGRAILAVDVPLDMAFEFAQSGSRRRIMSPDELLDDERPVEMLVDHATSRAARVVERAPEEGEPSDALPAENYNRPKPVPPIDWEANQEKIEESKAASKTAAAKEPWQLTKEEFIADPPEGFEYRPGPHRWEAYRMSRGLTLVGDTFFEGDEDSRRMTLNHEVGHDLMTDFNRDFKDVLAPFRLDHKPPEAPMDASTSFDNAFGSRNNPEEIVADTYAALFEGGYKWYTEDPKYINLVKRVVEVAQREGLPVPPEALRHFGGNVKTAAAPDSENFKAWFGKSKVVNPDGSPKVMYHGSPNAKSYRSEWTDDLKKAVRLAFEHINKPYPGDDNVDKNLDSWVDTVYEFDRRNRNVIPKEVLVGMGLRKVPFETFDERLRGKNVGPGYPDAKVGFFFTPDQNFARRFTYHVEVDFLGQKRIIDGYAPHIFEVYLRIENPLDLTNRTKANARSLIDSGVLYREGVAPENQWTAEEVFNALRSTDGSKTLQKALANNQDKLIPAGYDGIINRVKEGQYDKSNLEYIVFHPNQIKATTAKEFSREDARMTAAKRPVYRANWGTHLKKIKSAAASPDKPEGPPEAPQGSPKPVKTAASSGRYISSGGKPMTFYRGEASGERRSTSSTPRRQAGCSSSLRTPSTPNGMPEAGRNIGSFISRQRMSWT